MDCRKELKIQKGDEKYTRDMGIKMKTGKLMDCRTNGYEGEED